MHNKTVVDLETEKNLPGYTVHVHESIQTKTVYTNRPGPVSVEVAMCGVATRDPSLWVSIHMCRQVLIRLVLYITSTSKYIFATPTKKVFMINHRVQREGWTTSC